MRKHQIKREQLTDRQWSDLCEFFEAVREMARKIELKKELAGGLAHPSP